MQKVVVRLIAQWRDNESDNVEAEQEVVLVMGGYKLEINEVKTVGSIGSLKMPLELLSKVL